MTEFWKGALVALLVLSYVASPFDLLPGPIDDIILVLLSLISAREKNNRK